MSHCQPCVRSQYQPAAGQTACLLCPYGSGTQFEGSTACLACYLGQPVALADASGVRAGPVIEQPSPGAWAAAAVPLLSTRGLATAAAVWGGCHWSAYFAAAVRPWPHPHLQAT